MLFIVYVIAYEKLPIKEKKRTWEVRFTNLFLDIKQLQIACELDLKHYLL